jgi:hypothetical protein
LFDTINAKFLWKRIPKGLKEEPNNLKELWNIGKALSHKDYTDSFVLIASLTKTLQ